MPRSIRLHPIDVLSGALLPALWAAAPALAQEAALRAAVDTPDPVAQSISPAAPPSPRSGARAVAVANEGRMSLSLNVGGGRVIRLGQPATSLFAADPKVAEVRPASPTSLFVFGVAPGRTTVAALGESGQPVAQIDLVVHPSSFGSTEVAGLVRGGLARGNSAGSGAAGGGLAIPGVDVQATPGGYRVSGRASTPADAERVLATLRPYLAPGQTIDNRLAVDTPLAVNLRVRVVEVQRSVTRQLGLNWNAIFRAGEFALGFSAIDRLVDATNISDTIFGSAVGSSGGVNAVIDALAQDQLAVILAEPNLTAQSGETASFLAGGEYPIPIAQQNNTITVDYKQYGVSLAFVPTVLSRDRISLKVRPEVSELSTQGAVAISNNNFTLNIPALKVRRAETTVELGSGQSFAIAGLLSDSSTQNARGLPLLGELPVLGALFKSTSFQRGETELVIIVTPYLVRGVSDPTALVVPTRGLALASDLDRILYNRQRARGNTQPTTARIPLDAGFITP